MKRSVRFFIAWMLLTLLLTGATPVLSQVGGTRGPEPGGVVSPGDVISLSPPPMDERHTQEIPLLHQAASLTAPGDEIEKDGSGRGHRSTIASTWAIETVDTTSKLFSNMRDRSLALDAAGHPHIAYGQNHLYYAWHDGSTWHLETVDPALGVGQFTSLALDAAGRPHISYYDDTNDDLKYAHFDGTSWQIETVDSTGWVGEYTSLALDEMDQPQISYFDRTNGDLKYAHFDGSAWQVQTVDSTGLVGPYARSGKPVS